MIGDSVFTVTERHRNEDAATKVTEAKFTFVAIDEYGNPRAVDG